MGFPCGRFPPLWCFPPRCLEAAPLRFLCRAWLLPFIVMSSVFSAVPASGRPPGQRHGSGLPGPAAAEQRSMHNGQGLPPRAGSEYKGDLHPYGTNCYAPTDPRAFAARLDLITASGSGNEDALRACADMDDLDDLRACIAVMDLDDLRACIAMMDLFVSRISAAPTMHEYDAMRAMCRAFDLKAEMRRAENDLETEMRRATYDLRAETRRATFEFRASRLPATPAPPPATPTATPSPQQQFLEEQELRLAEDHIAFGAASRIQDDEDEARENELLCVQAVHSLVAQGRPCAREKDNAQYLEQENGVREINTTAAAKIFAVVHQDHYISKSTAADAPTGSTLNEPESRAFTTDPRPHAFGTKNVNLTVYSRAKFKVAPLARIRIDDEVYT